MQSQTQSNPLAALRAAYDDFLQAHRRPAERAEKGLQAVFRRAFPLSALAGLSSLDFVEYALEEPRFSPAECFRQGYSYASPLKLTIRLMNFERDPTGELQIYDLKEQEIYFGEIPRITPQGTFLIEGQERLAPFHGKPRPGFSLYRAEVRRDIVGIGRLRSENGHHLELSSRNGILLRLDDGPWHDAAPLLRIFGLVPSQARGDSRLLSLTPEGAWLNLRPEEGAGRRTPREIYAPDGSLLFAANKELRQLGVKRLKRAGLPGVPVGEAELATLYLADDIFCDGVEIASQHQALSVSLCDAILAAGVSSFSVLLSAPGTAREEFDARALYQQQFPEKAPPSDSLGWLWSTYARLGHEGHMQARARLGLPEAEEGEDTEYLSAAMVRAAREAVERFSLGLPHEPEEHLESIGDLVYRAAEEGLAAVLQAARQRLEKVSQPETLLPHDLINAKPFSRAIQKAFHTHTAPLLASQPLAMLLAVQEVQGGKSASFLPWPLPDTSPHAWPVSSTDEFSAALCPASAHDSPEDRAAARDALKKATPTASPEAPLVFTGQEARFAAASGAALLAAKAGEVLLAEKDCLLLAHDSAEGELFFSALFPPQTRLQERFSFSPVVRTGQAVREGEALAVSPFAPRGGLALGHNLRVLFSLETPENAPALVLSEAVAERLAECSALVLEVSRCDTLFGAESFTREIPGCSAEELRHLDARGFASVGASLAPGEVLAGLRSPEDDHPPTQNRQRKTSPRAPRDRVLRVPEAPGTVYRLLRVEQLSRPGVERDEETARAHAQQSQERLRGIEQAARAYSKRKLAPLLEGECLLARLLDARGALRLSKGSTLSAEVLAEIPLADWSEFEVSAPVQERFRRAYQQAEEAIEGLLLPLREEEHRAQRSPQLAPGVIETARFFLLREQPLVAGDWLADRHGNRAPVLQIAPADEMPKLSSGERAELLLPRSWWRAGLAVESRLGWRALSQGEPIACAPHEGELPAASEPREGVSYWFHVPGADK
jgi:DNA-directed RNA polymerase beta subunit